MGNELLIAEELSGIYSYEMALKKGLFGRNSGNVSCYPIVVLVFCSFLAPLIFFVGRGLYGSISIDYSDFSTTTSKQVSTFVKEEELAKRNTNNAEGNKSTQMAAYVKTEISRGKQDDLVDDDRSQFLDTPAILARRVL